MTSIRIDLDARGRGRWLALTTAIVATKALWVVVDPTPMLFLGDSESYLATALSGWIPPDRSFLYGYLLRPLAVWTGSLRPVVVAQTACSVVAALALAWLLTNAFKLSTGVAFALALAWAALEPLALLLERYMLAEAFALAALALFLVAAIRYLETRALRLLLLAQALATLVLALRAVFIPVALACALVLPVLAYAGAPPSTRDGRASRKVGFGAALAVSILATAACHQLYRVAYGQLAQRTPAYQSASGLFLLAAWSPLVVASDFPDPALGEAVLGAAACPRHDRHAREAARWVQGCLIDVLIAKVGSDNTANKVALATTLRVLARDPLGVLRLAAATWSDYFVAARLAESARIDRGGPYPPRVVQMLGEQLGVADAAALPALSTPTNRWFFVTLPWLMLVAATPVFALVALFVAPPATRRPLIFVAFVIVSLLVATSLGAVRAAPRFLHPLAWLSIIPLAVLAARFTHWSAQRARLTRRKDGMR